MAHREVVRGVDVGTAVCSAVLVSLEEERTMTVLVYAPHDQKPR